MDRRVLPDSVAGFLGTEVNLRQPRQQQSGNRFPALAAVGRAEHDASRPLRQRHDDPSGRESNVPADEMNRRQLTFDLRFLSPPGFPAILRVPDCAVVADRPAVLRVDKMDVAQVCISVPGFRQYAE